MHKHRFLTFWALYVALTLAHPLGYFVGDRAAPTLLAGIIQWVPVVLAMLIAPFAYGLFSQQLFPGCGVPGRALRVFAIVGFGALLRPYWGAVTTDHDFTFDNEPEVEFVVAFIEFVLAGFGFLCTLIPRRAPAT